MENYKSKATVASIKATSKVTLKIKDNFFSVEYTEERTLPDVEGIDVDKERKLLWDDVNAIVDDKANEIKEVFGVNKEHKL